MASSQDRCPTGRDDLLGREPDDDSGGQSPDFNLGCRDCCPRLASANSERQRPRASPTGWFRGASVREQFLGLFGCPKALTCRVSNSFWKTCKRNKDLKVFSRISTHIVALLENLGQARCIASL